MPQLQAEVGPISDATTNGVRVEVMAQHSKQHSKPLEGEWVFEYTVRITNLNEDAVQLISRHWDIMDWTGNVKVVDGPGVIGQQPLLQKGGSFTYSSWSRLETPTGMMSGTYQMIGEVSGEFEVEIAPFALRAKYTVH
jgi:ApaG protein